jgi:hypothetical protein
MEAFLGDFLVDLGTWYRLRCRAGSIPSNIKFSAIQSISFE